MKQPQKGILITVTSLVVVGGIVALFRYMKPGVYIPYKCDLGGDSSRKFYDPTWQARGAVCDGFWIPITAKLNGKDTTLVLMKMAEINGNNPIKKDTASMKSLAEQAASQL